MSDSPVSTSVSEKYLRINVTKNTKGYSYEKTASVRWASISEEDDALALEEVEQLLHEGDEIARANITTCELLDARADRT